MINRFRPSGSLDVNSDPMTLDEQSDGKNVISGAMTRCLNLHLERDGQAATRLGSTRSSYATEGGGRVVENNGKRYVLAPGGIYQDGTQISTAGGVSWTFAKYKSFLESAQSTYATNGTNAYRIGNGTVSKWGITSPTMPPSATGTGTGDTYDVYCTYARYDGTTLIAESTRSEGTSVNADTAISVSWTASSDAQVTHVRVYLSNAGGGIGYFVDRVAVGTTTLSITLPVSLGVAAPNDNDTPPTGITCLAGPVNGYLFAGVGNLLYFCKPSEPEYWPVTYYIEVGEPAVTIQSLQVWQGQLYILTTREIWQLQGTGADSFYPIPMRAKTGTISEPCAEAVAGYGIFHLAYDGLYLFNGSSDERITDQGFKTVFDGYDVEVTPRANAGRLDSSWVIAYQNMLYMGYPADGHQYASTVLVLDLNDSRPKQYEYSVDICSVAYDSALDELFALDTSGYVWTLEVKDTTTDNGTAISWDMQSKTFNSTLRKYFPRYARYDVEVGDGATATGEIKLNEVVKQSHAITSRNPKKRLITGCTGDRVQIRIYGTGPVVIHQAEVE